MMQQKMGADSLMSMMVEVEMSGVQMIELDLCSGTQCVHVCV